MKISVVIPCYNGSKYLAETLDSIRTQTIKPHEVILVDDGSTDRSIEIAKEYGVSIHQNDKNRGIGYTRQKGLELAKGSHIAFLSSDDTYAPDFLEKSLPYLKEGEATYTDYYRCDHKLNPFEKFIAPNFSKQAVIEWALKKNMFVNFSSMIIPKETQARFEPNLGHGEDLIFLLDTIISGLKWARVPECLVYYRIHPNQGTRLRDHTEFQRLWEYNMNRLRKLGVNQRTINQAYKESLTHFQRVNNPIRATLRRIWWAFWGLIDEITEGAELD